jgi:hypothetical protein
MHLLNHRLGRLTALIALGGAALYSQGTQTANISGEVVDKAGAPLAGVTVRLTSPSLQGERHIVSGSNGRFVARLLPPGLYTIQLTKAGMQTVQVTQSVGIGQTFEPRYTMVATGAAVVEVVSSAGEIDKTDVKSATNYRLDNVDQLPNARTIEGVAFLTPGVTSGVGGRVQIRGAMTSGNLYLLDGQNISDNAYNNRGVRLIDDSIEEVQVITGAISAEYGDVDGGVMNAITRSGGNEFQGQLRWELSNPSWNAYQPLQNRTALNNRLNEEKTLSLSGYIIKDKLWFSSSFFTTEQNGAGTIGANIPVVNYGSLGWTDLAGTGPYLTGNGPAGYNAPYDTLRKEIRRQIKLTWAITSEHTLVGSFNNARIDDVNRNYSAGETRALVPQVSTSEFANLQWRAIWSNTITSEMKIGRKKQKLSAGANAANGSPVYNYTNGYFYQNGIFNQNDGGDNRNNDTANGKVTLFWDAIGSHQTDMGFDYYKGTSRARNEQSATGYIFGVRRMNLAEDRAQGRDIWVYTSTDGEAVTKSHAFYVNDKWTLNRNLSLQLGVRFDTFKSTNESGQKTAGASGISPRLGLKYDLFADGVYVLGASYARYNAKALESVMNAVTGQGNPTEVDHPYIGPSSPQTLSFLTNLANINTLYDFNTITYYNNPVVNVRLADNLKTPRVDEFQLSFQYSFNHPNIGAGFLKLTGVHKKWENLFDYRAGNDGTVTTPDGADVYLRVWENSDVATRKYKSLEFEGQLAKGPWQIGGNVTWSELRGNYEGESSNSPGRGEGLKNFTIQDGVFMYDRNITSPEGYLAGHVPIRIRATGAYVDTNSWGKTTWGLVYRFDSGSYYSRTRVIEPTMLNPNLSDQYGSSATQYLGGRREAGSFPGQSYLDLAVTHDFTLFKVFQKSVNAFVKLNIGNVLNHQQIISYGTGYDDAVTGLNDPWVPNSNYGKVTSNTNFGTARTIAISTGFRF